MRIFYSIVLIFSLLLNSCDTDDSTTSYDTSTDTNVVNFRTLVTEMTAA